MHADQPRDHSPRSGLLGGLWILRHPAMGLDGTYLPECETRRPPVGYEYGGLWWVGCDGIWDDLKEVMVVGGRESARGVFVGYLGWDGWMVLYREYFLDWRELNLSKEIHIDSSCLRSGG